MTNRPLALCTVLFVLAIPCEAQETQQQDSLAVLQQKVVELETQLEQTVDLYAPDWEITVVPFDFYGSDFGARQRVVSQPRTPVADAGDEDHPTVADPSDEGPSSKRLDVSWTVNGRSAGDAGCCEALNIGRWELTISGAEERTVTSICGEHEWNTGDELHNLSAGSYRITLQAYDPAGQPLGSAATRTVELDAERPALTLTIDLAL